MSVHKRGDLRVASGLPPLRSISFYADSWQLETFYRFNTLTHTKGRFSYHFPCSAMIEEKWPRRTISACNPSETKDCPTRKNSSCSSSSLLRTSPTGRCEREARADIIASQLQLLVPPEPPLDREEYFFECFWEGLI